MFSARSELALTHHGSFHQVNGAMVRCDKTSRVFHHRGNSFTTLLWARKTTPRALPRNFAGASMIYFPQIRKDRHAPLANFKTFAEAGPHIPTIGVLTAKRRSDVGSDHVVLVLLASISTKLGRLFVEIFI